MSIELPLEILLYFDGSIEVPGAEAYEAWSKRTGKQAVTCISDVGTDPTKHLVDLLTAEQRLALFSNYCTSCGSDDPRCQCWNDE